MLEQTFSQSTVAVIFTPTSLLKAPATHQQSGTML